MFDREPGEAAVSVHVAEEKRDATVTNSVKYSLEIYAISFPASFGAKLQSSMVRPSSKSRKSPFFVNFSTVRFTVLLSK